MIASFGRRVGEPEAPETRFEDIPPLSRRLQSGAHLLTRQVRPHPR